jgi:cell division protein FtsX
MPYFSLLALIVASLFLLIYKNVNKNDDDVTNIRRISVMIKNKWDINKD